MKGILECFDFLTSLILVSYKPISYFKNVCSDLGILPTMLGLEYMIVNQYKRYYYDW